MHTFRLQVLHPFACQPFSLPFFGRDLGIKLVYADKEKGKKRKDEGGRNQYNFEVMI